ncbi:MAG: hypothetical protein HY717_03610 [Planctomycetes bacterium]|nr:hypothetical protein [Planctomycetota bacterium]
MKRALWIPIYVSMGVSFWLPGIAIHAIRSDRFGCSAIDLVGVWILPVVASLVTLEALARRCSNRSSRGAIALWMLLGIWMLGPLGMMMGSSFSGGGFNQQGTGQLLLIGLVFFVPITFMMSTYDGTLGALAVITVWFIVAAIVSLSHRWSEPPSAPSLRHDR